MMVRKSYKEIKSMDLVPKRRQGEWKTQNPKAKNKDRRVNAQWKDLGIGKGKQSTFLFLFGFWPFSELGLEVIGPGSNHIPVSHVPGFNF